ncbi:MAG: tRNA preQ1(34) S-adenosylmethionine ribosyltransferase-isomerase QueA [Oceanococcus sp.]
MKRSDFAYELPPELIAQQPPDVRSGARLLQLDGGQLFDRHIVDFPSLLRPGDLLVFNDTRVIPARLRANKSTGGAAEVMVERVVDQHHVWAFVRASKTPKPGSQLHLQGALIDVIERDGQLFHLKNAQPGWWTLLEEHGEVPLPPYIQRTADASDLDRYQTVFARNAGAVAAPTAGLHFDEKLLDRIKDQGQAFGYVTLHVGAGTFQPVRVDDLSQHRMHAERLQVSSELVERIAQTKAAGGRVVAIGTTVVRALETAAAGGELRAFDGDSRLFITPGYPFRVVDALLTNFHLPESTLLMLVSAFAGFTPVMAAYRHAVEHSYKFFSYGDAMWLERA